MAYLNLKTETTTVARQSWTNFNKSATDLMLRCLDCSVQTFPKTLRGFTSTFLSSFTQVQVVMHKSLLFTHSWRHHSFYSPSHLWPHFIYIYVYLYIYLMPYDSVEQIQETLHIYKQRKKNNCYHDMAVE